ncbi:unnamed protein product [Citrullus colocynthis]|uniref:Uncharacterized protein n=1 Tax=Citrullus colocynthis TaxID=252529 RepID=A0ABP0XW68_9ROSI
MVRGAWYIRANYNVDKQTASCSVVRSKQNFTFSFPSFFLSLHFIYFHLLSVSINNVPFFQPTTPFYVLPFSFSLIFSHTHIPIFVLSSNFFLLRDFHSISGFFTSQFHP